MWIGLSNCAPEETLVWLPQPLHQLMLLEINISHHVREATTFASRVPAGNRGTSSTCRRRPFRDVSDHSLSIPFPIFIDSPLRRLAAPANLTALYQVVRSAGIFANSGQPLSTSRAVSTTLHITIYKYYHL